MRNNSLILALILLATALVYTSSLGNPFVIDDRSIILRNFHSPQGWTLQDLFKRSLFAENPSEASYFRPLTLLTFALNYPLAGQNPQGYRAVNIALHLLVVVLISLLLRPLAGAWVASFTALLFALHPAHVQAVSYISSRSDPLYTALALLCLIFWQRGSQAQGKTKTIYLVSSLGAFPLGLFAKETMVVVPALVVLMDLIWNDKQTWSEKIKQNLAWYLGFLLLFSLYFLLRIKEGFALSMEIGQELDFGSRILWAINLFTHYLGLAFYPVHLSLFRVVSIPESLFDPQVVLGAMLLASMLILMWSLRQDHKEISFGILWYLISLLPVLNLTLLNSPMMEHWLYLPLIGLSLAFVAGTRILAERFGEVRGAVIGLTLVALLLSARTFTRNGEWKDLVRLYSQDTASYPTHPKAWLWLADALKRQGKWDEAVHAFKTSLALDPTQRQVLVDLVNILYMVGREAEVQEIFSQDALKEKQR